MDHIASKRTFIKYFYFDFKPIISFSIVLYRQELFLYLKKLFPLHGQNKNTMSLHIYRSRLVIVDHHISTNAAGNIEHLAHKLELSRAAAYKFLEEMKEEGFPIAYSKKDNRFYYSKSGRMIGYAFVEESSDNNFEEKLRGGGKKFLKIFSMSTYSRH